MKKALTFTILTIILYIATAVPMFAAAVPAVAAPPPPPSSTVNVIVNGRPLYYTEGNRQQAFIQNGRTLIPVRGVFEAVGFTVEWDDSTRTITLKNIDHTVIIPIGGTTFTANGTTITPDVPAQIVKGSTMLPLRAVCESLGAEVIWDSSSMTAFIEYKNTTVPELNYYMATRDSATTGTMSFISTRIGTCYYVVVDEGAAVPSLASIKAGMSAPVSIGHNTLELSNLTGKSSKDVYFIVIDVAGNESVITKGSYPSYNG